MAFFQTSVLQKALQQQDSDQLNTAWQTFSACFHHADKQANIAQSKEEQYQEGFLRDLFVDVFGYTLNPSPNFNLTTELKNLSNSKKVDGAILKEGNAVAVIELKGMDTTDLGKVEAQAFGYKNNQPHCRYVMTSNFAKLRFYIDNTVEYIEFDLFNLEKADFSVLFLLLNKDNLLADVPAQLKANSLSQEENITAQLYKDYSAFKRELFADLCAKNTDIDKLLLFKKSQKLLDRLLFIFFAEDRLLLPANFAQGIINEWQQLKKLKMTVPLYDRIKQYFVYLDSGYQDDSTKIFAYNGGLFKPDNVLDNLRISDEVLYPHIKKLAEYDFASEVDVNILGHIFENSLTEIEEIQQQLQGITPDKKQSKRKKDGVFYTPKYITKYIVENTVGKLCLDKKAELNIVDEDFYKPKRLTAKAKESIQNQANKLTAYRQWLLQLTICDPACGSGAFLNEALNFLIAEHRYIDELTAKLYGDSLVYQDIENSILENNLFGVDINEESVEIAKLSLWLRTAKPKRKLNNLNNNIKCGNSLISDPNFDKAFDWQKEFPQIFCANTTPSVAGVIVTSSQSKELPRQTSSATPSQVKGNVQLPYNPKLKELARALRKAGVLSEVLLWQEIKRKQFKGLDFDRQKIIGNYIVDFYCPRCQVVIEIDGSSHDDKQEYDAERDAFLQGLGLTVIHIQDIDVKKNLQGVMTFLENHQAFSYFSLQAEELHCQALQDSGTTPSVANATATPSQAKGNSAAFNSPLRTTEGTTEDSLALNSPSFMKGWAANGSEQDGVVKNGFDVVIGNPPYGAKITKYEQEFYMQNYKTTAYKLDTYAIFIERSIQIAKDNGKIGLIVPYTCLTISQHYKLRQMMLDYDFHTIVNLPQKIFEDADLDTIIILLNKKHSKKFIRLPKIQDFEIKETNKKLSYKNIESSEDLLINVHLTDKDINIINKIKQRDKLTNQYEISQGLIPYDKYRGHNEYTIKNRIWHSNYKKDETYKKELKGADLSRYRFKWNGLLWISYGEWLAAPREQKYFTNPRVCVMEVTRGNFYKIKSVFIDKEFYNTPSIINIIQKDNNIQSLKFLMAILNSRLLTWYHTKAHAKANATTSIPKILVKDLRNIPIAKPSTALAEKANKMLSLNKDLQTISGKFIRTLQRKFEPLEKLPKKLETWYQLSFAEFIKELNKKKIKLSLSEESDWEDYFLVEKNKALTIQNQINQTDQEIDTMVYELYGLTDEEIKVIEAN